MQLDAGHLQVDMRRGNGIIDNCPDLMCRRRQRVGQAP
jgi:hypothetical protein